MADASAPITMKEAFTLTSLGINQNFFSNVTMESDKYICVMETSPQNSVVIVDISMRLLLLRAPSTAHSALMNPVFRVIALKAHLSVGTTQDHLQIFNIERKSKIKSYQMPEQVVFWKWITPKLLGLVTETAVFHWSTEGESEPVKMFDRTANLNANQIINYRCDPSEKWLVLIGIAPGAPERPKLVEGNMQLFSVEQQRSQTLEAHAASFATFKVSGNDVPSTLISFATKTVINDQLTKKKTNAQLTSRLHVIELGAPQGKAAFAKKQADLYFPPGFEDDFPVAMQISQKHGLIYVITKLGLLYVYDLETATPVYRNRISPDPIFLTADAPSVGGFYAVNFSGQVLLATVNEATIVPFVSVQLGNLELAVNLAKRGNLPGAENLVDKRFQELFSQLKYKEAAELACTQLQSLRAQVPPALSPAQVALTPILQASIRPPASRFSLPAIPPDPPNSTIRSQARHPTPLRSRTSTGEQNQTEELPYETALAMAIKASILDMYVPVSQSALQQGFFGDEASGPDRRPSDGSVLIDIGARAIGPTSCSWDGDRGPSTGPSHGSNAAESDFWGWIESYQRSHNSDWAPAYTPRARTSRLGQLLAVVEDDTRRSESRQSGTPKRSTPSPISVSSAFSSNESSTQEASPFAPPAPEGSQIHYPSVYTSPIMAKDDSTAGSSESLPTEQKSTPRKGGECVVCLDSQADTACVPCGHVAGCMDCLAAIKAKDWVCPVCRVPIQQIMKIYTM